MGRRCVTTEPSACAEEDSAWTQIRGWPTLQLRRLPPLRAARIVPEPTTTRHRVDPALKCLFHASCRQPPDRAKPRAERDPCLRRRFLATTAAGSAFASAAKPLRPHPEVAVPGLQKPPARAVIVTRRRFLLRTTGQQAGAAAALGRVGAIRRSPPKRRNSRTGSGAKTTTQ